MLSEGYILRITYRLPRIAIMNGRLVSISYPHDPPRLEIDTQSSGAKTALEQEQ